MLTTRPNKLECLYLAITFRSNLTLAGNTRSKPRRKHLKGAPIGPALVLPSNSKTWLERVSKGKRSSLLGLVISDEEKEFYGLDTRSFSGVSDSVEWRRWRRFETRHSLRLSDPSDMFLSRRPSEKSLSRRLSDNIRSLIGWKTGNGSGYSFGSDFNCD